MKCTFDEENHIYYIGDYPVISVTEILHAVGIIDKTRYTEEGRIRGTHVHLATQYYDEGDLDWDKLDPNLCGFMASYKKFREDTGFKPLIIEKPIFNIPLQFAGTPDRIGEFPDCPRGFKDLVDFKSGGYSAWTALQTAGYATCLQYPVRRWGLQLKASGGTPNKYRCNDREDYKVFRGALDVATWKRKYQKGGEHEPNFNH